MSMKENHSHIAYNNWHQVFSASLGKVMANQHACSEIVVKGQSWNVDFSKGIILFGDKPYPLQFIGSESNSSNSWLWGWKNINHFPNHILQLANQMKIFGDEHRLEPLSVEEFSLDNTFNGHNLSIVTCALAQQPLCYYRGPHADGAIFVAFGDVPPEVFAPVDALGFSRIALQCIGQFAVDHIIFMESFLARNKTLYTWHNNSIIAHFEEDMEIEFEEVDGLCRVHRIGGILS